MNDKVLFIGASGFVGTRLIEISKAEFDVTNFDKQQSHFYPEITVSGDVRNQEQLDQALAGFDTVVLLAAEHRDDVSPTSLYYDVNVQGTRNVLAAMEKIMLRTLFLPAQLLFMVSIKSILTNLTRTILLTTMVKVSGRRKRCCVNGSTKLQKSDL